MKQSTISLREHIRLLLMQSITSNTGLSSVVTKLPPLCEWFRCQLQSKDPLLNDILMAGPSPKPSLYGVLTRFLSHNVAVVANIEKTFLQIYMHPDDRDYIRFLWFKDPDQLDFETFYNNELTELCLCRVLFGATLSPFPLTSTLIKRTSSYAVIDPDFVEKLLQALHVDDLNSGASTDTEAFDFYVKCKKCLREGGLNLHKFQSNSPTFEAQVYSLIDHQKS